MGMHVEKGGCEVDIVTKPLGNEAVPNADIWQLSSNFNESNKGRQKDKLRCSTGGKSSPTKILRSNVLDFAQSSAGVLSTTEINPLTGDLRPPLTSGRQSFSSLLRHLLL